MKLNNQDQMLQDQMLSQIDGEVKKLEEQFLQVCEQYLNKIDQPDVTHFSILVTALHHACFGYLSNALARKLVPNNEKNKDILLEYTRNSHQLITKIITDALGLPFSVTVPRFFKPEKFKRTK